MEIARSLGHHFLRGYFTSFVEYSAPGLPLEFGQGGHDESLPMSIPLSSS